MEVKLRKKS